MKEIVGRVTMIKDDGPGLLRLDEELGARPVATTEPRDQGLTGPARSVGSASSSASSRAARSAASSAIARSSIDLVDAMVDDRSRPRSRPSAPSRDRRARQAQRVQARQHLVARQAAELEEHERVALDQPGELREHGQRVRAGIQPGLARAGRAQLAAVRQQLDPGLLDRLHELVRQVARHQRADAAGLRGDQLDEHRLVVGRQHRHAAGHRVGVVPVEDGGHERSRRRP